MNSDISMAARLLYTQGDTDYLKSVVLRLYLGLPDDSLETVEKGMLYFGLIST